MDTWVWMPHAAHFIGSDKCQYRLATYLPTGYIVSTIGDYLPYRGKEYEEVGPGRLYETMVFTAEPNSKALCCRYTINNYSEVDLRGYNDPKSAYDGHMALCHQYAQGDN